jgi:hypothetical protein
MTQTADASISSPLGATIRDGGTSFPAIVPWETAPTVAGTGYRAGPRSVAMLFRTVAVD